MDEALPPLEWLAEHGPRDDEEAHDVAVALLRRRQVASDIAGLDTLTTFERELAERAVRAARATVVRRVEDLIGRTAETVSATALRQAVAEITVDLDFRAPRMPQLGFTSARVRAAELVTGATRAAERESAGEGLR